MLISYRRGQGSIILRVKIRDATSPIGNGKTGLTYNSAGLIVSTIADNESAPIYYQQASLNIEDITTPGTFVEPSSGKCRIKEINATFLPGIYEIQLGDARYAVANAKSLLVSIFGAAGMAQCDALIPLRDLDPYDAIRAGLSCLPNGTALASLFGSEVVVTAAGGTLFMSGSMANKLLTGNARWSLSPGGNSLANARIQRASQSDFYSGLGATWEDCQLASLQNSGTFLRCAAASLLIGEGSEFDFVSCYSNAANGAACIIDFNSVPNPVTVRLANWRGPIELRNMTRTDHVLLLDGDGGDTTSVKSVVFAASCTNGKAEIAGHFTLSNLGSVSIRDNARFDKTELAAAIGSSGSITVAGPVISASQIALVRGDDYYAADSRALAFSSTGWPNLTGASVVLNLKNKLTGALAAIAGTVTAAGGGTQTVQFELPTAVTSALAVGAVYNFNGRAVLSNGHKVSLCRGELPAPGGLEVLADYSS